LYNNWCVFRVDRVALPRRQLNTIVLIQTFEVWPGAGGGFLLTADVQYVTAFFSNCLINCCANSSTSLQTRHPICKTVNEFANSVPYCHAVFANLAEFTNPSTCLPTINRHVVNSYKKRRRVCTNLIHTFSNT
jgi:hypothetical protein